ncbi:MAG: DUF2959 domain-containing protein [Gammaproteobacteria bacterium]|nr:MAG: DUF2959 domain-containing protein [Gammaproteobacteria bacterium]
MLQVIRSGLLGMLFLLLSGCQSTYYAAMEKIGVEKRDILVDRVENARDAQSEAQEEFESALEALTTLTGFEGGELQEAYETLKARYEDSESAAEEVSERINKVEDVAEALFDEWEAEISQYTNARYKADSQKKLRATRARYQKLIRAMRKAESRMKPVLAALKDNVLYLKHNLNAQAIGALDKELSTIRRDVERVIRDTRAAIAESDAFIRSLDAR